MHMVWDHEVIRDYYKLGHQGQKILKHQACNEIKGNLNQNDKNNALSFVCGCDCNNSELLKILYSMLKLELNNIMECILELII